MKGFALTFGWLLIAALCSCNPTIHGGLPRGPVGTVTGEVTESPCRPVQSPEDGACPGVPAVEVSFQGRAGTAHALTNALGIYRIELPAGRYTAEVGAGLRHFPVKVTVFGHATVRLDLSFDAGIR